MNMQKVHSVIPILLLAVVLAGCDAISPTSFELLEASVSDLAIVSIPLSGHCETSVLPHPTQPGPPIVRQIDEGTCRLAHLGLADFYSVKDINFATGTQITTEAFLTAANGDVLRFEGSGTSALIAPGLVSFSATLTFIGGTGRFASASGDASVEGVASLATQTASFDITDGTISYRAFDRRE